MPEYNVVDGSPQDEFGKLRSKIQIFGGGFGNGKTAASCVQKILMIARDYPGANILVARSTYPKLNDTIRKEFLKWCPKKWIKSFPLSKNADNTCVFVNGTTINFRYVAQQGRTVSEGEQTTSNLLSATYDLIVVDQLEDPEITEKDFDDLLGRLRGNARYIGNDPTMPRTGPRWFVATTNPTRNWVYRSVVAPLKKYQETGMIDPKLLCLRVPRENRDGSINENADEPILGEDGKPQLLISLVEGSTYTNSHNLGEDFLTTLESRYRGQMRDRYLYGHWAAYEGLVHPEYSEVSHNLTRDQMYSIYDDLSVRGVTVNFIEGYDFGIAVPSCYLLAFVDRFKNVFIVDGFYYPEEQMRLTDQQKAIWSIRATWGVENNTVWADPAIFKRTVVQRNTNAKTIAQLFNEGDHAVHMRASDNEVIRGITKVNMYLNIDERHRHPVLGTFGAPHLYVADHLGFVADEFTSYYWKVDPQGERTDDPVDRNDHAMNTIKYMLAKQPDLASRAPRIKQRPYLTKWQEGPDDTGYNRRHRYGG